MARQTLGVDIEAGTIRTVLMERGIRGGRRVAAFRSVDLSDAAGRSLDDALAEIFADGTFHKALWAAAIPTGNVSFRTLVLPFADARKVRQVLPFEVEPLIPLPIEDVYIACLISREGNGTRVIAAAAERSLVRDRMGSIAAYVGGDGILDVGVVPMVSLLLERGALKGGEILLDIDETRAVAVFIGSGRIVQIRYYSFGIEAIASVVSTTSDVARATADEPGREGGPHRMDAPESDVNESLVLRLIRTVEALQWNGEWGHAVSKILVTGEAALNEPLRREMAERFSVSVERLDLAGALGVTVEDPTGAWQSHLMNGALALALRAERRGAGFDFARIAKKERKGAGISRKALLWTSGIAAVVFTLGLIEFSLDYYLTRLRLNREKEAVVEIFKRYAPDITRIVDPVQQLTAQVNEVRRLAQGLTGARAGLTLAGILREISVLVPPSTPLLIETLVYEGDTVVIKGETENFDTVNVIKNGFAQSRYFAAVAINSSQLMKREGKVSFEMRITMR